MAPTSSRAPTPHCAQRRSVAAFTWRIRSGADPHRAIFVLPASLVLTGVARFAKHDHSTLVLIAFIVSALATLFGLLFLAGEVIVGHE